MSGTQLEVDEGWNNIWSVFSLTLFHSDSVSSCPYVCVPGSSFKCNPPIHDETTRTKVTIRVYRKDLRLDL